MWTARRANYLRPPRVAGSLVEHPQQSGAKYRMLANMYRATVVYIVILTMMDYEHNYTDYSGMDRFCEARFERIVD